MMTHVISDDLTALHAVYDDAELISVRRPQASATTLASRAEAWLAAGGSIETQWSEVGGQPSPSPGMLTPIADEHLCAALGDEIAEGVEALTALLKCREVRLRVATLDGPMCPRFHTDLLPCRMLITVAGPGTEWIAHDDVDGHRLADRSDPQPPVRTGGHVRTVDSGAWSLLKGGRWDQRFDGVVHRSPLRRERRLLVTFDPVLHA